MRNLAKPVSESITRLQHGSRQMKCWLIEPVIRCSRELAPDVVPKMVNLVVLVDDSCNRRKVPVEEHGHDMMSAVMRSESACGRRRMFRGAGVELWTFWHNLYQSLIAMSRLFSSSSTMGLRTHRNLRWHQQAFCANLCSGLRAIFHPERRLRKFASSSTSPRLVLSEVDPSGSTAVLGRSCKAGERFGWSTFHGQDSYSGAPSLVGCKDSSCNRGVACCHPSSSSRSALTWIRSQHPTCD